MFNTMAIASTATASTTGLLYQAGSTPSFFSVRPHTRPCSSLSVLRELEVSIETATVTLTQTTQAHQARQKLPAMDAP